MFLAAAVALAAATDAAAQATASVQVFINTSFVAPSGGCSITVTPPFQFLCPLQTAGAPFGPLDGDISNDPHIEFELNGPQRCNITPLTASFHIGGTPLSTGTVGNNFCNDRVFLCTQVGVGSNQAGDVVIDEISFEVFKFQDGSNPLDPASTPPLRTFFIDAPGSANNAAPTIPSNGTTAACVMWDGSANIQGEFGKTNGQYGFRVLVKTNQQGAAGNLTITATRAYPSGAALDSNGVAVSQKPINVDVTNVHVIRSSPTVVGQLTGVAAQPYNFTYRLSKDSTMYLTINNGLSPFDQLRRIVPGLPRTGEGTPQGTLLNGDSWDGRDENGAFLTAGNYLAVFQANSADQFTNFSAGASGMGDLSIATTRQVAIDPLQITDLRVQPLAGGATSLAVLSYMLTEAATVYIDIYPPGTQFCPLANTTTLNNVTSSSGDPETGLGDPQTPVKKFGATLGTCGTGTAVAPLRSIIEIKAPRVPVISFWDGRDANGGIVEDGDYIFVIYAALPSQRGTPYRPVTNPATIDKRIWTTVAKSGLLAVVRGLVGITQITPTSTIVGSSPALAGVNPFTFRYSLTRDANVTMKIFNANGTQLIKTLVNGETRPGNFANSESWTDGADDAGRVVSSGTYLVQLSASDPMLPGKTSTTTASFPVDMFRITDVTVSPLLSGTSDNVTLSYQLSQPMFVAWNVYPAGSVVVNSNVNWPPCPTQSPPGACTSASVLNSAGAPATPVVTFRGMRAGRLKISEFWDGRDANGIFVPDGNYVFTLSAQSTTTPAYFATDRIYGNMTVARGSIIFTQFNVLPDTPQMFNSSNTITLHPFTINYSLTRQSSVTIQILNTSLPSQVVRTIVSGAVRPAGLLQTDVWDGRNDRGNFPPTGFYLVRAVAEDVSSALSSGSTAQLTISFDPLRIYDLAITPLRSDGNAAIAYQVSETMKVAIKIYKPGTIFDPSGIPSPPDATSLVKRIVGVRPARTAISDVWNGTDLKLALTKDGNYKFKIVGSTDLAAIDDINGDVINPSALSLDRLIDEIPVVRNASLSPAEDFANNTFNYPNPVTGPSTTFEIYTPFRAHVKMKLHTMAGDVVLDKDFGEVPPSYQAGPVTFVWSKMNQSGNKVARGLYFAVIRIEESEGGKNVLQTVKKVLIQ
jgi:flagellar hook assembly protein FlgD